MLDTTAYIDALQDKSPGAIDDLMALRICNHSAVCLAELTHAYGALAQTIPVRRRAWIASVRLLPRCRSIGFVNRANGLGGGAPAFWLGWRFARADTKRDNFANY